MTQWGRGRCSGSPRYPRTRRCARRRSRPRSRLCRRRRLVPELGARVERHLMHEAIIGSTASAPVARCGVPTMDASTSSVRTARVARATSGIDVSPERRAYFVTGHLSLPRMDRSCAAGSPGTARRTDQRPTRAPEDQSHPAPLRRPPALLRCRQAGKQQGPSRLDSRAGPALQSATSPRRRLRGASDCG